MPVDSGRKRHCGKRARPRAVEEEKVLNGMQEKAFSSFCGEQHRRVQPPDAEDRTSGGVGGVTGAIPLPRPAQSLLFLQQGFQAVKEIQRLPWREGMMKEGEPAISPWAALDNALDRGKKGRILRCRQLDFLSFY